MSILDDLALDSRSLAFQQAAYGLQLSDQLVNFPHRGSGHALKQ